MLNWSINWIKKRLHNHAIPWMYALGAFFFLFYGYINYYTSKLTNVPSYHFPWESKIPFVPWMIIPYMSSDIIFVIGFMIADTRSEVRTLAKRVAFVIAFSVLCYFLFPLKFSFMKPDSSTSIFYPLFNLLTADLPFNQCPSLHISQGFIFWMSFLHLFKGKLSRTLVHIWFILIYISTLTVYQHHFIDILGGQAVALISFVLFVNKEEIGYRNKQLAYLYYFISFAWFSSCFFTPTLLSVVLCYFALNYFFVGMAYYNRLDSLLKKDSGKHSILMKFLFGHFLFCTWLWWFVSSSSNKKSYAEVVPGLFFGERPRRIEKFPMMNSEKWAIIDLAPEISEHPELIKKEYYYFPLNDVSFPRREWLLEVADKIESLLSENKKIYVHCRLGQTRSAMAICAYLIFKKNIDVEEAFIQVESAKKVNIASDLKEIFKG